MWTRGHSYETGNLQRTPHKRGRRWNCQVKRKEKKLFSGILRMWSLEDWEEIKALKHPCPVRDFSADPSGKLLLTIANDKTLKTKPKL